MGQKRAQGRAGVYAVTGLACIAGVRYMQSGAPDVDTAFVGANSAPGAALRGVAVSNFAAEPALSSAAAAASFAGDSSQTSSAGYGSLFAWGVVAALSSTGIVRSLGRSKAKANKRHATQICAVAPSLTAVAQSEKIEGKSIGTFPDRPTPLLDSLNDEGPQKLRQMSIPELTQLADEVRWQVLDAVSVTGGHLGSALGMVELTVALHHVFDTPNDEIVWDVAHQVYPHKVLTGRRGRIYTLRQGQGLSGFAKRAESEYDAFGAGHSATSVSAAVGFEEARKLQNGTGHSVAVIGDGAITGGMAWEAMNHAGGLKSKIMVILNDNGEVSLPTKYNAVDKAVGGLAKMLEGVQVPGQASTQTGLSMQGNIAKIETSNAFQTSRMLLKDLSKNLPPTLSTTAAKLDEYARDFFKTAPFHGSGAGAKGELFEQLGFYYVGPIDGHNIDTMVEVLKNLKSDHEQGLIDKPILLHIKTEKGKGYAPAENASDKLHAVTPKFNLKNLETTEGAPPKPKAKPLTTVFGESLVKEGLRDEKIVAITAAMPGGTGVHVFEKEFGSKRTFDVGIAEQHAVTFAGALAAGGMKPFCCIYSTFLQRGYDQIIHDVALQNLPVRFVLDRAGLVGGDGPTHGGAFDLSYLACIPNIKICAPADESELVHMTHTLAMIDDSPSAMRYPRASTKPDVVLPETPEYLEPGKGRIVREGDGKVAILSVGSRLCEAMEAAERLESFGISATVADARWVKPLDEDLVKKLADENRVLVTVEENSIGGFSALVTNVLQEHGYFDGKDRQPLVCRAMVIPDRFIAADNEMKIQYDDAELNASHIMTKVCSALKSTDLHVDARVLEQHAGKA